MHSYHRSADSIVRSEARGLLNKYYGSVSSAYHMGGVRAYAAEGAIVVVHSSAGDYIRAILGQRRTLEPDQLEIARRDGRQSQPVVVLVDDAIALTDGAREVKLHHVPNNHSSGMLVGYVPDAGFFSPPTSSATHFL